MHLKVITIYILVELRSSQSSIAIKIMTSLLVCSKDICLRKKQGTHLDMFIQIIAID